MAKPEQYFYPLTIAASVITIWLLLRKNVAVALSSGSSPVVNIPTVGGLATQYLASPEDSPALDFNYIQNAISNPLSTDPNADAANVPSYLTYNTNMSAPAQPLPGYPAGSLDTGGSGGGCGTGACGGCSGGCSACEGPPCPSGVFLNGGRSGCLSNTPPTNPNVPITGYAISSFYENMYGGSSADSINAALGIG